MRIVIALLVILLVVQILATVAGIMLAGGLNRNFLRRSPSATQIRNVRSGGA